ncbi:MAG: S8 family serine peptidase [bacterium]|nr:S8 family serine peptidase [bacterium]
MKGILRCTTAAILLMALLASPSYADLDFAVNLKSRVFTPNPVDDPATHRAATAGQHVMIQFDGPLDETDKENLAAAGIEVLDYIPNYVFTARLHNSIDRDLIVDHNIRWFGQIPSTDKLSPMITDLGIGQWARREGDRVQFSVVLHKDESLTEWADYFQTEYDAEIIGLAPVVNAIDLVMPEPAMYSMIELDAVLWLQQAPPPPMEDNNSCRENTGAEIVQAAPYSLTGTGVMVAEWDGGLADNAHGDLVGRVFHGDNTALGTHATHVAGTVMGSGAGSSGTYRGMASNASLVSYLWWGSVSEMNNEYLNAIDDWGADLATNSWGYGVGDPATESNCQAVLGNYFTENTAIDNIVRGGLASPVSIFWSAGNQRGSSSSYCGSIGWTYGTIGALSTAKNIVTVGAINSNNSTMTSFSSWGPTDDGRIKPDVVGPGCQSSGDGGVTSTKPGTGYTVMCGTSMSTPAIAGVAALLYQQYTNTFFVGAPIPSTVKAILINTADDLGTAGPDYQYGHGRVDAVEAAEKMSMGEPSYFTNNISSGVVHTYDLTVPGGASKLKATLVWDDVGGTASASVTLINDLDLVLIDPFTNTEYPWVMNPTIPSVSASKGEDHLNNVETVEIDNPTPGLWKARVTGFNVPQGPQTYSLVFTPDSIYTPGNLAALAVFDNGDIDQDPGLSAEAEFWVTNVGAARDSLSVVINDDNAWLTGTIDTIVALDPWDSAYFAVNATVPPGAFAGDNDQVTCAATSLINVGVSIDNMVTMTANAYYGIDLALSGEDTTGSPSSFLFTATVTSSGNSNDPVTIVASDLEGWLINPAFQQFSLPPFGDSTMTFTVGVPSEVLHLTANEITINSISSGGPTSEGMLSLVIDNPYQPPGLSIPENGSYSQDRSPSFTWTGSADSYALYIATDTAFSSIVHSYSGIGTNSFTVPESDSLADGLYYWAVRLYVGADSSSLQANPFSFVVDNTAPLELKTISPSGGEYVNVRNFLVVYGLARGSAVISAAPEYNAVELSQDSTFVTGVNRYDPLFSSSYLVPDTLPGGRWYWRVQRADSAGNASAFSAAETFILDYESPVVPTLLLPADNGVVKGDVTIKFSYGGTPPPYETSAEYVHVQAYDASFTVFYESDEYQDSVVFPEATFTNGELYYWRVRGLDSAGLVSNYSAPFKFNFLTFQCGDIDGAQDGVTISDLTFLVDYLFNSGPAPDPLVAGSVNCDLEVDVSDLTAMVDYLFAGGAAPCCQ